MPLDNPNINLPDRVVINDLDAELAEIEAEEELLRQRQQEVAFFLPDEVEKQIGSVPESVLQNNNSSNSQVPQSQALILYKNPFDSSILDEEGAHRKAVREARERMRENRLQRARTSSDQREREGREVRVQQSWPGFEPVVEGMDEDMEMQPQRRWQAMDDEGGGGGWEPDEMDIE